MANSTAERQIVSLKIVHTSDVHGSFFMRDYVNNHAVRGSLSRVYAYVQSLRKVYGKRLLLMDGGDGAAGTGRPGRAVLHPPHCPLHPHRLGRDP